MRAQIDGAAISSGRWKYIVVHNSSTKRGGAKAFDTYHRDVKRMSNGMAYHFVIGNGSYTGSGQIEVGQRWKKQLHGGHMKSSAQNRVAIGICLVGDFDSDRVKDSQLEALDELVSYLQAKTGKTIVTTHRRLNIRPTSCPGKYFPDRRGDDGLQQVSPSPDGRLLAAYFQAQEALLACGAIERRQVAEFAGEAAIRVRGWRADLDRRLVQCAKSRSTEGEANSRDRPVDG